MSAKLISLGFVRGMIMYLLWTGHNKAVTHEKEEETEESAARVMEDKQTRRSHSSFIILTTESKSYLGGTLK